MLKYFPDNYTLSLAASLAIGMGGQPSEVEDACAFLRDLAGAEPELPARWAAAWSALADRLLRLAEADEVAGRQLSASTKYRRAAAYLFTAERILPPDLEEKNRLYVRGQEALRSYVIQAGIDLEWIEIPFGEITMPALFLSAAEPGGRAPAMIHLDGFDVHKESLFLQDAPGYVERGVSILLVDHPGVGEALRLRNQPLAHDLERPAGACLDYLETRSDVDSERVGTVGVSLGGYYAPRAAAFEPRLACCACWGTFYDATEVVANIAANGAESVPDFAMTWVFGLDSADEVPAVLERYTLAGVIDKVTCPIFILHGENDHQVPLAQAQRTYDEAVHAADRELRVLTTETGGDQHCQVDNPTLATQAIQDWAAETLGANRQRVAAAAATA